MKKRKYIIYSFTALAMTAAVTTGCKKFLDVNKNLNSPTNVPVSLLLSGAERSIGSAMSLGSGLGGTTSVYVHQTTGRVAADRYGGSADGAWSSFYNAIANLDVVIKQGTSENRFVYVGIAKILKAYTYSVIVDMWGDCPYTEVDRFDENIKQPKYDKGVDIYPKLLALLDEGVNDMNNTAVNPSKPGADDYIYKGNVANWIKAVNTIKLKMYTQMRLVQDVKAKVQALLATPANLINSQAESFMLPFGPNGTTDDRHPAYGDYNATQRGGQLFSPWLYEIMKGRNANILNGNPDPRIPYYIYNQKTATGNPENCTEFRDGGFITILFGSNGPCRDGSNSSTYSLLGVYPAGGRYDQGLGQTITAVGGGAVAGTGALPHQFLTYADRLYLEAELINVGAAPGDQRAVFSKAMDESFNQVDYIITNYVKPGSAGAAQTVPTLAPQMTTYKANVLTAFDAASDAKKLEYIMTEKWINRIENPVDSYTDYRRTGYPVLFSPAPIGTVTSVTGPDGKVTPVSCDKKYPVSLPFSANEISLNSNSPAQKVPETYKVFWQP